MIKETITLELTAGGEPYFESNSSTWVAVHISDGDATDQKRHIEVSGHAAGLRRLGEILIAVSNCRSYHMHLENAPNSPLTIHGDDIELIIANLDEPPPSDPPPNIFIPDWARG